MSALLVLRLAFRNVLRNRRRSLLSGSVVFFGVFFLIFARGFIDGIEYGTVRAQIDTNCAHLRILAAGADDEGFELPLTPHLADAAPLLAAALEAPGAVAATPRLRFSGELSDGRSSLRVIGVGVEPGTDDAVFELGTSATAVAGDPPGALVGAGIATLFDLHEGDPVTIVARTPEGSISALDYLVRGIFSTGNTAVDNLHVLVPIASARQLLAFEESAATEVAVLLEGQRQTSDAARALATASGPEHRIETWVEATEDVRSLMRVRRKGMSIIVAVLMAIAAAGIANTVLMSIYERFREIGTMSAFGFTPWWVRALFLLEGTTLGILGSLAGVVAGAAVVGYFQRHGIDISSFTSTPDMVYPTPAVIYLELTGRGLLLSGLFGVAIAALATLGPARRASLLDPVEALRA